MNNSCTEITQDTIIVCEEKNKKFILRNNENIKVEKITVDGCIYPKVHKNERCDFALNFDNTTVLIELKGSKISKAIQQILETFKDAKFKINSTKYARVITGKCPKIKIDSSIAQGKKNLKKIGFSFQQYNTGKEESIENFLIVNK